MGVLTDDESLVDAALSELLALPLEQRYERDPGRNVDYLLTQYHLGQVRDPFHDAGKQPVTVQSSRTPRKPFRLCKMHSLWNHQGLKPVLHWQR